MNSEISNALLEFAFVLTCVFLTVNCGKEETNTSVSKQIAPLQSTTPDAAQFVKITGKPCPARLYEAEKENPRCAKLTIKLINASSEGDVTGIKNALEAGANIDVGIFEIYPPLHQAAAQGRKDAVVLLLNNGADVNDTLTFGNSSLLKAVTGQHPDIVRTLLERGADVCPKGSDGPTLLQRAEWYEKNQEIADLLKQAGGESCKQATQ